MNVILCGLPMTGKTTIGKALAKELQWYFLDSDEMIEWKYKEEHKKRLSCRQIFHLEGEDHFRKREKHAIESLKERDECIIAVGGGAFQCPHNVLLLKATNLIVYLETPLEDLFKRMDALPAYLDPNAPIASFEELAKQRIPIYEKSADVIVSTENKSKKEIVQQIIKRTPPKHRIKE